MAKSPTQQSLQYLREQGFKAEKVERWNQWAKKYKDLFDVFDIVALHPSGVLAGVQTTTSDNMAARRRKILASENALAWLNAGGVIFLHGWKHTKKKGQKYGRWFIRLETIQKKDFGIYTTDFAAQSEDKSDIL